MTEQITALVTGALHATMIDYVKESADALMLTGWVRGSTKGIELVAQGPEENLVKLIQKLHQGSSLSQVEAVEVRWSQTAKPDELFRIVHV